jgi:ectoine hydroxylase
MNVVTVPRGRARVTAADVAKFRDEGFLIVRGLYSVEEARTLKAVARLDPLSFAINDETGKRSKIFFPESASHTGDVYNAVSRCSRMVDTVEALMGDEVWLYHHKVVMKDAESFHPEEEGRVGGRISNAWAMHQDYGYWYHDDNRLYPDLGSCAVAMDTCTVQNGCMTVLKGSQKLGRLEHQTVDGQVNADPERVALVEATHERVSCTMSPGDALFFHANTLHASAPNSSLHPRWTLVCCFCCRKNTGAQEVPFLETWPDSMVLESGRRQLADLQGRGAKL